MCFKYFNNPLESTLVFSLLCYSWTHLCVFLIPSRACAMPVDECLHKFGFIYIYIYIYMMYFQVYT